jgi:hypothetical protein
VIICTVQCSDCDEDEDGDYFYHCHSDWNEDAEGIVIDVTQTVARIRAEYCTYPHGLYCSSSIVCVVIVG